MGTGYSAIRDQSKIIRILKIPNFLHESTELCEVVQPFKHIRLRNICFRYPQHDSGMPLNPAALDFAEEITFKAGTTYALVGRNVCGKSTLLQLVCKLQNKLDRGSLYLNSIAYPLVSRTALRTLISYVSQRPYIFPGTIYENIAVVCPAATYQEVFEASLAAGLFTVDTSTSEEELPSFRCECFRNYYLGASLVSKHGNSKLNKSTNNTVGCQYCIGGRLIPTPSCHMDHSSTASSNGEWDRKCKAILNRETGTRGGLLSGGIMQSVALARIFLRKSASIVILDEAFGQMDAVKKREVILPKLLHFTRRYGMSLIMVTHEVEIARFMDHIVVLDGGNVQHQGTHEQLIASRATYYMQLLGHR